LPISVKKGILKYPENVMGKGQMKMIETQIKSEVKFSGRVFDIHVDDVALSNGSAAKREVVLHPGGVGVLALRDGKALLVRQYRYAAGREMLEIPAGKLEPGEDPLDAGIRELSEETGWKTPTMESLGVIIPTGGYCSERIYLYLAQNLSPGETHPDEGEFVDPVWMELSELREKVLSGELQDSKTIVAVVRAWERLQREANK
jgi:ADP-ribose pyrophosphatase